MTTSTSALIPTVSVRRELVWTPVLLLLAAAVAFAGPIAAIAALAATVAVFATVGYLRRPIHAVLGLWVFLAVQGGVAAGVGAAVGEGARSLVLRADEPLLVLFLVLSIGRIGQARAARTALGLAAGFVGAGLLSALLHGVPPFIALLGAWLGAKLWIALVIALALPWTAKDREQVARLFGISGIVILVTGVLDFLAPAMFRSVLHLPYIIEYRHGLPSVQSVFSSPGAYSGFMSLLFAFFFGRFAATGARKDLGYSLAFGIGSLLSLRLKAMLDVPLVLAVAYALSARGRRAALAVVASVLGFLAMLSPVSAIARSQIATYGSAQNETARRLLYRVSGQIARSNFPFGVGFGRFGSWPSTLVYSPVFYQYGLSGVWGLSPEYRSFINDTTWPTILGESGVIGVLLYGGAVIALLLHLRARLRDKSAPKSARAGAVGAITVVTTLIAESAGSPIVFNSLPVMLAAVVIGSALIDHESTDAAPANAVPGRAESSA
ncbi:MAG: hypothetical protein QOK43_16 [Acidimicrobiaceae bacterium]|nr:hypothetical protein [Acidimicrobiaceae bacterium]